MQPSLRRQIGGHHLPLTQQFLRSEHMTRAADEIEVPQSTISRGIARLEDDLGVALFVRAGRTVRLTREGRTLLRYAERALAELAAADREIRGGGEAQQEIELARATEAEKQSQLDRLADFQTRHAGDAETPIRRLQDVATGDGNVFDELMKAARVCSLGQLTDAFFEVGGQYRRNM